MSGNMYGKHKYYPSGYNILGPGGKIIGFWYAGINIKSVSVDPQNQTVEVLFQNPENNRHYSISAIGRVKSRS
jgi:hypothetical protein